MTDVDVRFRVVMPDAWTPLPLHAPDRKARLRRLVRDRMGRSDELAAERYELAQVLERWAREIEQLGAFFAATYEELFDGSPVAATLVATTTPRPPLAQAPEDPVMVAGQLAEQYQAAEDISVVDLRLGPAVRVRERAGTGLKGSDGRELDTESLQFFVPLGGTADMMVLTFSTPTLALADRFVELFDAIARTAHLDVTRDDPGT